MRMHGYSIDTPVFTGHVDAASKGPIRLLVVDEQPIAREGIVSALKMETGFEVVGTHSEPLKALAACIDSEFDIVLIDPRQEGIHNKFHVVDQMHQTLRRAKIIVFSTRESSDDCHRALQAGAVTFLSKKSSIESLIHIIREVYRGRRPVSLSMASDLADRSRGTALTIREREVLEQIAKGKENKEIAQQLRITKETVQVHVRNIFAKLEVSNRTEAAVKGICRGIIDGGKTEDALYEPIRMII